MGDATAAPSVDSGNELSRFRQLLFGDELREHERRLQALERRQQEALERARAEQQQHFDQLESLFRAELARLGRAQRRDREERARQVQQLTDRLDALARDLTQALGARIDALHDGLAGEARERENALLAQAGELRTAFDAQVRSLESELEQAGDRLQQVKADRDELARLFGEVAQRLNRQLELPAP
jgi:DNA anti-recombination protein RmuC